MNHSRSDFGSPKSFSELPIRSWMVSLAKSGPTPPSRPSCPSPSEPVRAIRAVRAVRAVRPKGPSEPPEPSEPARAGRARPKCPSHPEPVRAARPDPSKARPSRTALRDLIFGFPRIGYRDSLYDPIFEFVRLRDPSSRRDRETHPNETLVLRTRISEIVFVASDPTLVGFLGEIWPESPKPPELPEPVRAGPSHPSRPSCPSRPSRPTEGAVRAARTVRAV